MEKKIITIQTNKTKKGKLDQRSFHCQVIKINGTRNYVLIATEKDLSDIAPGCKIFEDGEEYRVRKIFCWPSLKYTFITTG